MEGCSSVAVTFGSWGQTKEKTTHSATNLIPLPYIGRAIDAWYEPVFFRSPTLVHAIVSGWYVPSRQPMSTYRIYHALDGWLIGLAN